MIDYNNIEIRLKALPSRAIIAFAARGARRVFPRTATLADAERETVERAIGLAESFANGYIINCTDVDSAWDDVSAVAKRITGDSKTWCAVSAAVAAACATAGATDPDLAEIIDIAAKSTMTVGFAQLIVDPELICYESDLNRLSSLGLGEPGTVGQPIDTGESGSLGPLWPKGEPDWST